MSGFAGDFADNGGGGVTIATAVIGGTAASVLFIGSTGLLDQDNALFNYNKSTSTLTGGSTIRIANASARVEFGTSNISIRRSTLDMAFETAAGDALTLSTAGGLKVLTTTTAAGTTGAQTINKASGTVNFAAGATTLVVTNSLVTATSLVWPFVRTNDATAVIKNAVCGAGSFTITLTASATAETSVGFVVINA